VDSSRLFAPGSWRPATGDSRPAPDFRLPTRLGYSPAYLMRKRVLSLLPVATLVLAGLWAVHAAASKSPKARAVTLTYALWDQNQGPAMRQIANAFQASHPGIRIVFQPIPFTSYFPTLEARGSKGSLPDVFWMNGINFALFAADGYLMPLDGLITASSLNLSDYPSRLVNLYTYKGTHYALPKDFDVIGLWYNKALFRAAHIHFPDSTWTWRTLDSAAKRLTNPKKRIYGFEAYLASQEGYYNTIYQNDGFVISKNRKKSGYDDSRTIGGLKFWIDLIKAGVSPSQSQMAKHDKNFLFMTGKTAMIFGGDWLAKPFATDSYLRGKVDVAVLPKGKRRATVIHGVGNVISAKTRHPAEAWQFLQFLGSRPAANTLARTGTVIPAFKGTQKPWFTSFPPLHLKNFVDELSYPVAYPVSQKTAQWNAVETKYFTMAWNGQMGIGRAARIIARRMNTILATERK
jgi:multiple sugar transport system substrate-binding protein